MMKHVMFDMWVCSYVHDGQKTCECCAEDRRTQRLYWPLLLLLLLLEGSLPLSALLLQSFLPPPLLLPLLLSPSHFLLPTLPLLLLPPHPLPLLSIPPLLLLLRLPLLFLPPLPLLLPPLPLLLRLPLLPLPLLPQTSQLSLLLLPLPLLLLLPSSLLLLLPLSLFLFPLRRGGLVVRKQRRVWADTVAAPLQAAGLHRQMKEKEKVLEHMRASADLTLINPPGGTETQMEKFPVVTEISKCFEIAEFFLFQNMSCHYREDIPTHAESPVWISTWLNVVLLLKSQNLHMQLLHNQIPLDWCIQCNVMIQSLLPPCDGINWCFRYWGIHLDTLKLCRMYTYHWKLHLSPTKRILILLIPIKPIRCR